MRLYSAFLLGVIIVAPPAMAQFVFYDEWEDPTIYPTGIGPQAFLDVWEIDICDSVKVIDDCSSVHSWIEGGGLPGECDDPADVGRAGRGYKIGDGYIVGYRHKHVLTTAELQNAAHVLDPNPNSLQGTDEYPLQLTFYIQLGTVASQGFSRKSHYMELVCGDDRAPTPMVVEDCGDGKLRHHIAGMGTPDGGGDGQYHASIAIGQIPMTDLDPCLPLPRPETYRLSIYDGLGWHLLKDYPTGGTNIHVCPKWNRVTMKIKTTTIDVELTAEYDQGAGDCVPGSSSTMTTTVNRKYEGWDVGGTPPAFSAVVMAGQPPDERIDPETQEPIGGCWSGDKDDGIENKPKLSAIDEIHLSGGESYYDPDDPCNPPPVGACCVQTGWGSGTCDIIEEVDCTGTWLGEGATCDECEFCPDPFADTDDDGDVDQDDFGKLQACITGHGGGVPTGCECFNQHVDVDDPDIDEDDYAAFEACASGPDVPADPFCDG